MIITSTSEITSNSDITSTSEIPPNHEIINNINDINNINNRNGKIIGGDINWVHVTISFGLGGFVALLIAFTMALIMI